jgi:hypothetical protein
MQYTAFTLASNMLNTCSLYDIELFQTSHLEWPQSDGIMLHRTGFNEHYSTVVQRSLWDIYHIYCNGWEKDLLSCQVHLEKDEKALYHLLDLLVLIISVYRCHYFLLQSLILYYAEIPLTYVWDVVILLFWFTYMLMLSFFCSS